jgi:hypothetical protein
MFRLANVSQAMSHIARTKITVGWLYIRKMGKAQQELRPNFSK